MTDTPAKVLAARALIEAYDALNSDEHRADVDKRRELDLQREEIAERIAAREDAYEAAMNDKHAADEAACASGMQAALNEDAARTIIGKPWVDKYTNGNHPTLSAEDDIFEPEPPFETFGEVPEEATARANGAYSED